MNKVTLGKKDEMILNSINRWWWRNIPWGEECPWPDGSG
jgi:hypothetical protein